MTEPAPPSTELLARDRRLQQGIDGYGVGTWELNLATQELACSATARKLLGVPADAPLTYDTFISLVDPDDREQIALALQQSIEHGDKIDVMYRVAEKDRPSHWLRARGGVVHEDGASYLCGIVLDIDQQKVLEQELRLQQGQLRSILDTVPDAMILIDGRGIMRFFSRAAERMFGMSEREAIGQNISVLMPRPDATRHDNYIDRYNNTGERHIIGIGRIVTGRRKDGSTFPIHLSIGEMESGGERYFTGFIRDLTEYQQTQARLHELQAELVHVSRLTAMGEMASALAHELNQPLSAISNYMKGSRRLLAGSTDPNTVKIESAMERAAEQALRAGQIIRRLRDFVARGESEKRVESLAKLIEEAGALGLTGARNKASCCASLSIRPMIWCWSTGCRSSRFWSICSAMRWKRWPIPIRRSCPPAMRAWRTTWSRSPSRTPAAVCRSRSKPNCFRRSSPPRKPEWGSDFRSAVRSSRLMAAGCGRKRTAPAARRSASRCRWRPSGI